MAGKATGRLSSLQSGPRKPLHCPLWGTGSRHGPRTDSRVPSPLLRHHIHARTQRGTTRGARRRVLRNPGLDTELGRPLKKIKRKKSGKSPWKKEEGNIGCTSLREARCRGVRNRDCVGPRVTCHLVRHRLCPFLILLSPDIYRGQTSRAYFRPADSSPRACGRLPALCQDRG